MRGIEVHKLYLSAILDLCDRHIVSQVVPCCMKSGQQPLAAGRKIYIFFFVLLTGSSSPQASHFSIDIKNCDK
jgi:hypothetical protein